MEINVYSHKKTINFLLTDGLFVAPAKSVKMRKRSRSHHSITTSRNKSNNNRKAYLPLQKLLAQTTINYWNTTYLNCAMNFIETLLKQTGCITYACNISEEAVIKLHNEIKEKKWIY